MRETIAVQFYKNETRVGELAKVTGLDHECIRALMLGRQKLVRPIEDRIKGDINTRVYLLRKPLNDLTRFHR